MNLAKHKRSYLAGIGIGLLSWGVFVVVNAPLGITTSLSGVSGAAAMPLLGAEAVAANPYWAKTAPKLDYGTLFLFGTLLGAFLSAVISREFVWEKIPSVWRDRFGGSTIRRYLAAFIGGVIIMFGARMAGGCTSGHGISGSLQFAVSSWIFFPVMFLAAVLTARILFPGQSVSGDSKEGL